MKEYNKCDGYVSGFAIVKIKNKYGVIDINFKEIVKCECNSNTEAVIKLEKI